MECGYPQRYFHSLDVEDIIKIKIPRSEEDFVAWHYERTGCFSFRSANRLGIDLRDAKAVAGSSARPNGERPIWKKLWKLPIPQKVKVFAWRVAHNGLATQANKIARKIAVISACALCGDVEDVHHAVIQCPHARDLRLAMRGKWAIPTEEDLHHPGHEWLLHLIDKYDAEVMGRLVLILWRACYIRNELAHTTRKLSITASVGFLMNYWESLCAVRQQPGLDAKGKRPVNFPHAPVDADQCTKLNRWEAPGAGIIKVNVDGAFADEGSAGYGVVIRDEKEDVLLSAWGIISNATNAEEVELIACQEGAKLAARWVQNPTILESDCLAAINLLLKPMSQRSASAFIIKDALSAERSCPCFVSSM